MVTAKPETANGGGSSLSSWSSVPLPYSANTNQLNPERRADGERKVLKLVIPYIGVLRAEDARLVCLAEFLGIRCEPLSLGKPVNGYPSYLESALPHASASLVVNPAVMREWVANNSLPEGLSSFLLSHFHSLIVHAVGVHAFDTSLVASLSGGAFSEVHPIQATGIAYDVSPDSKDICGEFSGLSFGAANPDNDRVFKGNGGPAARRLISIGDDALMATVKTDKADVVFIGSQDVADLDAAAGTAWVTETFSRLLPHAMALRHLFGDACWRAIEHHATVIVDDPLLRANYGFLNFEKLLSMTREHNFHTSIAFIPHNCRRSSRRIVGLFRENADRLSLCVHGNDHTGAEFAARDEVVLNTMLLVAEERIVAHQQRTGLSCDRVMVFPQGQFSVEAMATLRSQNFEAAVNTVTHPRHEDVNLTLREMAQPAVLRYSGFPLFVRRNSMNTGEAEIAFNLFFGRAVFIVEHHNIFENPQPLLDAVSRINTMDPGICWSSLSTAVSHTLLRRVESDGTVCIRAYARTARILNDSNTRRRFLVEWTHPQADARVDKVTMDGLPVADCSVDASGVRMSFDLEAGASAAVALVHRASGAPRARFGLRHSTRAFVRRRLSEMRDNYLSKSPSILAAARAVQRKLQRA